MTIFKTPITKLISLSFIFCLAISPVSQAELPTELLEQYNRAAQGDESLVDSIYKQFEQLQQEQGDDPLVWIYFGSTGTLKGRDAWMPWNKLRYTEQGLDNIQRGIDQLYDQPLALAQQKSIQGLPEYHLAIALAATTYTSVPKFFNRFGRGYSLFSDLLGDAEFLAQNFSYSAWIYESAVKAALKASDMPSAQSWLLIMQERQADHPLTQAALALVKKST